MRTIAPAKINWTLEVLGRRADGYHEIRSVMQTIDLCDEVSAERSDVPIFETVDGESLAADDFVVRAARALEDRVGRALSARIRLHKLIPIASGLGGGSSDAAAVLRLLNRLYELGLSCDELSTVGASVGSDVPFFVYGETALVEGRGECVTSLPYSAKAWLVLVVPRIRLQDKTKRMYEAISVEDFGDGSRGQALSQQLRKGNAVQEEHLYNVFERAASKTFDGLDAYRDALMSAGANTVHLAGAGPALFFLAGSEAVAREMAQRTQTPHAKVFFAQTMGAQEATAVSD